MNRRRAVTSDKDFEVRRRVDLVNGCYDRNWDDFLELGAFCRWSFITVGQPERLTGRSEYYGFFQSGTDTEERTVVFDIRSHLEANRDDVLSCVAETLGRYHDAIMSSQDAFDAAAGASETLCSAYHALESRPWDERCDFSVPCTCTEHIRLVSLVDNLTNTGDAVSSVMDTIFVGLEDCYVGREVRLEDIHNSIRKVRSAAWQLDQCDVGYRVSRTDGDSKKCWGLVESLWKNHYGLEGNIKFAMDVMYGMMDLLGWDS